MGRRAKASTPPAKSVGITLGKVAQSGGCTGTTVGSSIVMKSNETVTKVLSLVETEMRSSNLVIGDVELTENMSNSVSPGQLPVGVEGRCDELKSKAKLEKENVQEWKDITASPQSWADGVEASTTSPGIGRSSVPRESISDKFGISKLNNAGLSWIISNLTRQRRYLWWKSKKRTLAQR